MPGVSDASEIAAVAAAIAGAPLVAFDLEFVTADRLVPVLCLVQVAWIGHPGLDAPGAAIDSVPSVAVLDALAADVGPVVRALAAHPCVIAHAPRQDLQILASRFGVTMPGAIDTQVMAAFAGIGDQIGLGNLAHELLGITLAKEQQWTDWTKRPLSAAQLDYAAADVLHLPRLYRLLAARLGPRLAWARAETAEIARDAEDAAQITPETAWKSLGGLRGLDAATLSAIASLAAWRLRLATELDKPLGWVLADRNLIELARARPATAAEIRATKGLSGMARQRADELLAAIAAPAPMAGDAIATRPALRSPSVRAQRWSDMLLAIAQLLADDHNIAARLLATRHDAEEFARLSDEEASTDSTRPMQTWRRAVIGERWLAFVSGTLALTGDPTSPHGLRLHP